MLELPAALSIEQQAGREPLQEPLPVGARLRQAFARQLALVPDRTRQALLIAAASTGDEPGAVAAALAARRLTWRALEPAEHIGSVTIAEGRIMFRHPLLRSVIYQSASGEQRRAAHAALAAASDRQADRRAWHFAAAASGPDDRVAAALEDAALRAAGQGGLTTAARTFERAASLSIDNDARCGWLLAAAGNALASGRADWAMALIDEGLPLVRLATMPLITSIWQAPRSLRNRSRLRTRQSSRSGRCGHIRTVARATRWPAYMPTGRTSATERRTGRSTTCSPAPNSRRRCPPTR